MAEAGEFITVQMASGRIVRARVVSHRRGQMPLVTWGGLAPFYGTPMVHQDILDIEAGQEHLSSRMS